VTVVADTPTTPEATEPGCQHQECVLEHPHDGPAVLPDPDGVVLAMVDGGSWRSCFGLSLLAWQIHDAAGPQRVVRHGCGYIADRAETMQVAAARNRSVERMLHTQASWLWMVDTDMGFGVNALDLLLESADPVERPVVGGLCFAHAMDQQTLSVFGSRRWRIQPTIYQWAELAEDQQAGRLAEQGFLPVLDYPPNAVIPVGGTGAAMLLVHRSALLKIRDKHGPTWFTPAVHPTAAPGGGPRIFSEDLSFCIRAQSADVPIHVDTRVGTTHDKGGIYLDQVTWDRQRLADSVITYTRDGGYRGAEAGPDA
jgi:hypothetical protein